jgi:periplasmic divalent cation tolerance protein
VADEILILITAPNAKDAGSIAEALVSEQLAACVNIIPAIESVYRWEGKVSRDNEALLIVKTTNDCYPAIEPRVKELHSYTTPEVISLKIERGSAEYLKWLRDSVLEVPDSGEDHR